MSNPLELSLNLLEELSSQPAGNTPARFAEKHSKSAASIQRVLKELVGHGYVRATTAGTFRLTTKLARLGMDFLAESGADDIVDYILIQLAAEARELVRFAVLHDDGLVWVTRSQGVVTGLRYDPARDYDRAPHLATTATGQAWLSTMSDAEARRRIKADGLMPQSHAPGPNAPRSIDDAIALVQHARQRGCGLAIDLLTDGMAAVAAPIFRAQGGGFVGCVSISGPSARLTEARLLAFKDLLLDTAKTLGEATYGSRYFPHRGARTRDLGEAGVVAI